MRYGVNSILAILATATLLAVLPVSVGYANTSGAVQVTPATVRLELAKGATSAQATITLKNTYLSTVNLHAAIARAPQNVAGDLDPVGLVDLSADSLDIDAGSTATETLSLHDDPRLSPGSQIVELVLTQHGAGGQGVGFQPEVRLPVSIIKADGAIMSLGLTNIASPRFMMGAPKTVDVALKNTGNMIIVPRGTVTIRGPRGTIIGTGVVNTASSAMAPGKALVIPVTINASGGTGTAMPGLYRIDVAYGLGGDAIEHAAQKSYIFISWIHIAAVLALGAILITAGRGIKHGIRLLRARQAQPTPVRTPPPKRRILIGRNA